MKTGSQGAGAGQLRTTYSKKEKNQGSEPLWGQEKGGLAYDRPNY